MSQKKVQYKQSFPAVSIILGYFLQGLRSDREVGGEDVPGVQPTQQDHSGKTPRIHPEDGKDQPSGNGAQTNLPYCGNCIQGLMCPV